MRILSTINSVIPFADPSRPVWIDIIYSLILCTILWLGPQIQDLYHKVTSKSQLQPTEALPQDSAAQVPDRQAVGEHQNENEVLARQDTNELDDEDEPLNDELDPAELAAFQQFLDEQPGPANPPAQAQRQPEQLQPPAQPARLRDPNRHVGAKKARSLARRQQIRAYHEFLREQSDQQRALDASTREQREASQAAERKRREEAEARIRKNEEAVREAKRAKEKKDREEEVRMVKRARDYVRKALDEHGILKLSDAVTDLGRDEDWLVSVLKTEGILGPFVNAEKKYLVMVTGSGYIVRISDDEIKDFFMQVSRGNASAKTKGVKVSSAELGSMLSTVLLKKSQAAGDE